MGGLAALRSSGLRIVVSPQTFGFALEASQAVVQDRPVNASGRTLRATSRSSFVSRVAAHDRGDHTGLTLALECSRAGSDHFVERGAEREDVRPRIDLLRFQLLGGHVMQRTEDGSLSGEPGALRGQRGRARRFAGTHRFRQPKVEELRPGLGQHDVPRLQIPMHDPLPVRLVQRIRDLDGDLERLIQRQRAFVEPLGQGPRRDTP